MTNHPQESTPESASVRAQQSPEADDPLAGSPGWDPNRPKASIVPVAVAFALVIGCLAFAALNGF